MRPPFLILRLGFLILLCFSNFHPASASLYETLMGKQRKDEDSTTTQNLRKLKYDNEERATRELIINGIDASPGEYPWFVELMAYPQNSNPALIRRCGGAMISGDTVLTVANCLYDLEGNFAARTQSRAIIKRENNVKKGKGVGKTWKVIRPHPNHTFPSLEFNVALIQLSGDSLFPEYDIGPLNDDEAFPAVGTSLAGVGYGPDFETLQQAVFTVTNAASPLCEIPNNLYLFCLETASLLEGVPDFCPGDEGAPLVRGSDGYQTLYGLYAGRPELCTFGQTDSIAVKIETYRSFILSTLCEISGKCLGQCTLFDSFSGFAAESLRTVAGYMGGVWQFFVGPPAETTAFPDDGAR